MASRGSVGASHLRLPFDPAAATRLSWHLGEALASSATRTNTLHAADAPVRANVYDVDGPTSLVVVRTPAGRERHYELPSADAGDVLAVARSRGFRVG